MNYKYRTKPTVMFANCGHGKHRRLEDCVKHNFISAGQGKDENRKPDTFGKQIRERLIPGDILAVYRSKVGYVGIAQVISKPMDINNARLSGKKITRKMFSKESNMFENFNNDYKEWLVEVKWLTEVHLDEKKKSGKCFGIFWSRNTVRSLDNQPYLKKQFEKTFNLNFKNLLEESTKLYSTEVLFDEDDKDSFLEGIDKYEWHRTKERNSKLIKEVKENHYRKDKMMRCQVCEMSFVEIYGELGQGFIEAHHVFPISELKQETETKIEDIVLVCSNCHRMLHRKRPWVTIKKLKSILKTKNNA